jgi:hypothetical protein
VEQAAIDPTLPGLTTVLDRLQQATFGPATSNRGDAAYAAELERIVQRIVVEEIMRLAADADMAQVRALAAAQLHALGERLARSPGGRQQKAHQALLATEIRRFLDRDDRQVAGSRRLDLPPGSPIGEIDVCSQGLTNSDDQPFSSTGGRP